VLFAEVPRVIYQRNPLDEVVCHLRFVAVDRIEAEPPMVFRDQLRERFPHFTEQVKLPLPPDTPSAVKEDLRARLKGGNLKSYEAESADERWAITLERNGLSLVCREYERWETFQEWWRFGRQALEQAYAPGVFTRVGLHYRDVIRRSLLGLSEVPWRELLQPGIAGMLGAGVESDAIQSYQTESVLCLPDGVGQLRLRAGLGTFWWQDATEAPATQETVFIVESEFYREQEMEPGHVDSYLDALHRHSGHFFRGCITSRLHEALDPHPVAETAS
jgi:uncharacterized protein (TIGR04255 family)